MNDSKVIAQGSVFDFKVPEADNNSRIDIFVAKQFSSYSRSFFKKLIDDGLVSVNGKAINKVSYPIKTNDDVIVKFPIIEPVEPKVLVESLGVEVVFEHSDFLILYKPAGVLTHAATTSKAGNLVDWILSKFKDISSVGSPERPGIVHRLDMNTSGLIIITRNNYAHEKFGNMFKDRKIKKTYLAIVEGDPKQEGFIDYPISRHSTGSKMTVVKSNTRGIRGGVREALTNYKTLEYFQGYALVEAKPVTGRTHQIRVHFAAIGHPIVGDSTYGKASKLIDRHALHAYQLEFEYEGQQFVFKKDMPKDFVKLIESINN